MPEPVTITLAAVGMAGITEGIKFLYSQASELLKWRHEKHKAAEDFGPDVESGDLQFRGQNRLRPAESVAAIALKSYMQITAVTTKP